MKILLRESNFGKYLKEQDYYNDRQEELETQFAAHLEELVRDIPQVEDYFEESSIQGGQGTDSIRVTLKNGYERTYDFDYSDELDRIDSLGPDDAAQYFYEIILKDLRKYMNKNPRKEHPPIEEFIDTVYITTDESPSYDHLLSFRDDIMNGTFAIQCRSSRTSSFDYRVYTEVPWASGHIKIELARPIKLLSGGDLYKLFWKNPGKFGDKVASELSNRGWDGTYYTSSDAYLLNRDVLKNSKRSCFIPRKDSKGFRDRTGGEQVFTSLSDDKFRKIVTKGYEGIIYYPSKFFDSRCDANSIVIGKQANGEAYILDDFCRHYTLSDIPEYGYVLQR